VQTTEVALEYLPPSYNVLMRSHWRKQAKLKADLQQDITIMLLAVKLPRLLSFVRATAVLIVPDRRKRDEGNYRTPLEKALGDALAPSGGHGWLPDDTPQHYRFERLEFEHVPRSSRTLLSLEYR
jgi:hypothetical protein